MADMVDVLLAGILNENDPSATGISDITIDQNGDLVFELSDGREIVAGSVEKYPTYDTMPSTETLLSMASGTIFNTRGFYTAIDGHGGTYRVVANSNNGRGGLKISDDPARYLVSIDTDKGKACNYVDVCKYGIREYDIGTIDYSTITPENCYADINSDIISRIHSPGDRTYFQFPIGRFFFRDPISRQFVGIRGNNTPYPAPDYSHLGWGQTLGGTILYFPFLTNGQAAFTTRMTNIENVVIYGNARTYKMEIDRSKTISAPDEVVTETIAKDENQEEIKCTGIIKNSNGYIKNVVVLNFYTGIYCATANIYLENVYAKSCHVGISLGNDCKAVGVYGWHVHTLLQMRGAIASAVQVRVDSCVHAVHLVQGSGMNLTDVDGDYCTDSLILVGDVDANGDSKWYKVSDATIVGAHGRCCCLKSYDNTQTDSPDVRTLQDTSGYGIIHVHKGCQLTDSFIVLNANKGNPFDTSGNYRIPSIILTRGSLAFTHRNKITINSSTILDAEDILKNFQVNSDLGTLRTTGRFDTANGTFYLRGNVITKIDNPIANPDLVGNEQKLDSIEFVGEKYSLVDSIEDYKSLYSSGINVKEYDATGDGTTDDSQAFIDAIAEAYSQNKTVIIIPRGTYNLNNVDISLLVSTSFVGEGPELTKILNSNITATSGIECIGITFDGGTIRNIDSSGGTIYSGMPKNIKVESIIIECTPVTDCTVHYKNCVFKNAGTGSFAYKNNNGSSPNALFTSDLVENCVFENLLCAGIYHSLEIDNGIYCGNIFRNMGSEINYQTQTSGYATYCCLKIGDSTNSTDKGAKYALIRDNLFDYLLTRTHTLEELALEREDASTYGHRDEGYFVGIHGEVFDIFNNTFLNQVGYAHDREGLYTKARRSAHIHDNYFENAGLGEGYICCKQANSPYPDRLVRIHNNTLKGINGTALALYADCEVFDNYIYIANCKQAIWASSGSGKYLKICRNVIDCGVDEFYLWNELYTQYYRSTGNIILKITNFMKVYITDNKISLRDNLTTASKDGVQFTLVNAQSIVENFICEDNFLYADKWNRGINMLNLDTVVNGVVTVLVSQSFKASINRNKININPSSVSAKHYAQPIRIRVSNDGIKYVEVVDNVIENSDKSETGVIVTTKDSGRTYTNNVSTLKFDTKQVGITYAASANYLSTDTDYLEIEDRTWVS